MTVQWTGNTGDGTREYTGYLRDHEVIADGVGVIAASSDAAFRGDPRRWNPELLFVASVSECHMLWYLHLAAQRGVVVEGYSDRPQGVMTEDATGGGGSFTQVLLQPRVTISAGDPKVARAVHDEVGDRCFIARSVSVPIRHLPEVCVVPAGGLR